MKKIRLGSLTPIFDNPKRMGAIVIGNTPPGTVTPPIDPNMVMIWNTNLTAGLQIYLGLHTYGAVGVDVLVDWGDGNTNAYTAGGEKPHTYAGHGTYAVTISGTELGEFATSSSGASVLKLIEVVSWGTFGTLSLKLEGCENLTAVPADFPSTVTEANYLFANCNSLNDPNIAGWDVSNVENMYQMFASADIFNQDISGWDVSNVYQMDLMFFDAAAFNQDLSGWCVTLIPSAPFLFDDSATAWVLPRPSWGTCPP